MKLAPKVFAFAAACISAGACWANEPPRFNDYVLKAVNQINSKYAGQGYGQSSYTHDLSYGGKVVRASKPPQTMCVAAVAEVIITALDIYMKETGDKSPLDYLPVRTWERMSFSDLRSHIWVDPRLKSYGTADALSTFGIGRHAKFSELTPGSFINLNRDNKSGHAVVFLGFIDKRGDIIEEYSNDVAGFKYFSSQGRHGAPGSGFGYRYAFFDQDGAPYCPNLKSGMKRDCTIIFSNSFNYLNTGYMIMPKYWDRKYRDQSLSRIAEKMYMQDYSRAGGSEFPSIRYSSKEDFRAKIDASDVMTLDPKYSSQDLD